MLRVQVSADGRECTVQGAVQPCANLVEHLEQELKISKSTPVVLVDAATGRTGNALSLLMSELKRAGYASVMTVGFITEPGA